MQIVLGFRFTNKTKVTKSHNNIVNYGKYAIEHQGARKVVFQFDNDTEEITEKWKELTRKYGVHG